MLQIAPKHVGVIILWLFSYGRSLNYISAWVVSLCGFESKEYLCKGKIYKIAGFMDSLCSRSHASAAVYLNTVVFLDVT
jgi:hypothetical protein